MFISIENIILDYYFNNGILLGVSLGGSSNIILCYLNNKYDKYILGSMGKDSKSNIINYYLNKYNINNKYITYTNNTNSIFIDNNIYSNICPYCDREYHNNYDINYINLDNSYSIILDNLDNNTINYIKNINNDIFLFLNKLGNIVNLSLSDLKELNNKFKIIIMDVKVYHYLKNKFLIDNIDIYEIFNPDLLIIYRYKYGASFIYNDIVIDKEYDKNINILDSSGSMEIFFSNIINCYINNNKIIDDIIINKMYIKAMSDAIYVSLSNGAIPLYKINNYKECICKYIE